MRLYAHALVLVSVSCLLGCDAFRSFESICQTRLKPTLVDVQTDAVSFNIDHNLSYEHLTQRGAAIAGANRIVLGLTTANLSQQAQLTSVGMVDRRSGRYCMRPEVRVKLSFNPMTVNIGSNEAEGSCPYRLTYEHELRHVSVYQTFLPEIAARVRSELETHFGNDIYYFKNSDEAHAHIDEQVERYLAPLLARGMDEVRQRQRQIDAPEEYARLDALRSGCSSTLN